MKVERHLEMDSRALRHLIWNERERESLEASRSPDPISNTGWRGVSSSCEIGLILSLVSFELRLKGWKPPITIKNPCVFDHRRSNDELEESIRNEK